MEKKVIVSEKSPAAIGPYSQAIEYNGIVYTSGVIGVNPATGEVAGDKIETQAEQSCKNVGAILEAAGLGFDNVVKTTCFLADAGSSLDQAIKTTVFIKNMDDFAKVNEIYATYFTGAFPARSCVEVARLPKDLLIEVEVTAIKG